MGGGSLGLWSSVILRREGGDFGVYLTSTTRRGEGYYFLEKSFIYGNLGKGFFSTILGILLDAYFCLGIYF